MLDSKIALQTYRLNAAEERLASAAILLESGQYKDSIGRAYYAMFTAVRAILAKDGVDFYKHAGVISYFQKNYIKTGQFDTKYSKYLSQAFQIRNNVDYTDFFVVAKRDAEEQMEKAKAFVKAVKLYILKSPIE